MKSRNVPDAMEYGMQISKEERDVALSITDKEFASILEGLKKVAARFRARDGERDANVQVWEKSSVGDQRQSHSFEIFMRRNLESRAVHLRYELVRDTNGLTFLNVETNPVRLLSGQNKFDVRIEGLDEYRKMRRLFYMPYRALKWIFRLVGHEFAWDDGTKTRIKNLDIWVKKYSFARYTNDLGLDGRQQVLAYLIAILCEIYVEVGTSTRAQVYSIAQSMNVEAIPFFALKDDSAEEDEDRLAINRGSKGLITGLTLIKKRGNAIQYSLVAYAKDEEERAALVKRGEKPQLAIGVNKPEQQIDRRLRLDFTARANWLHTQGLKTLADIENRCKELEHDSESGRNGYELFHDWAAQIFVRGVGLEHLMRGQWKLTPEFGEEKADETFFKLYKQKDAPTYSQILTGLGLEDKRQISRFKQRFLERYGFDLKFPYVTHEMITNARIKTFMRFEDQLVLKNLREASAKGESAVQDLVTDLVSSIQKSEKAAGKFLTGTNSQRLIADTLEFAGESTSHVPVDVDRNETPYLEQIVDKVVARTQT